MSSVTSNANVNPDFNVYNTVVSEGAVNAVLGPMNLENLLFAVGTNPNPAIALEDANHTLVLADYVQAIIGQQQIKANNTATTRELIFGGADNAATAAKLQLLLGMTETNNFRTLSFIALTADNDDAASGVVNVGNGTATSTNVIFNAYESKAATDVASLYDVDKAVNGVVKRVQAYCTGDDVTGDFLAGSEKIRFRVLSNPATGKV